VVDGHCGCGEDWVGSLEGEGLARCCGINTKDMIWFGVIWPGAMIDYVNGI
jgi:hypothetical protein